MTSILSGAISTVITRSGYSCPVTSRAPSAFCAEDAQKTGKCQVHACNSTLIIIITVVAVVAIITFTFSFSVLLRFTLSKHVTRRGLLMLGRLIDWSAVPCDNVGFVLASLTVQDDFGGKVGRFNSCLRFFIAPPPPQ